MRILSFLIVLSVACIFGQFAEAQDQRFKLLGQIWQADTRAGKLVRTRADLIRVAPQGSDDNAVCKATTLKQIGRALYSCPSILRAFQMAEAFRLDISTSGFLADADSQIAKTSMSDAAKTIEFTKGRDYPAYDVALILAHYHSAFLNHLQGDAAAEREHVLEMLSILGTTPADVPKAELIRFLKTRID